MSGSSQAYLWPCGFCPGSQTKYTKRPVAAAIPFSRGPLSIARLPIGASEPFDILLSSFLAARVLAGFRICIFLFLFGGGVRDGDGCAKMTKNVHIARKSGGSVCLSLVFVLMNWFPVDLEKLRSFY